MIRTGRRKILEWGGKCLVRQCHRCPHEIESEKWRSMKLFSAGFGVYNYNKHAEKSFNSNELRVSLTWTPRPINDTVQIKTTSDVQ